MKLSKKQITLSHFFASFLKSTSTFSHFGRKDEPRSLYIFDVTDWERRGEMNV